MMPQSVSRSPSKRGGAVLLPAALALAAVMPGACREPPPPLPEPLERFAPENLPAAPDDYPSLGGVPDRPADLPTPADREAMRRDLERDRDALRAREPRSGPDLLPAELTAPALEAVPDEATPLDDVPNPAIPDSLQP
jgi:hypothetical protein